MPVCRRMPPTAAMGTGNGLRFVFIRSGMLQKFGGLPLLFQVLLRQRMSLAVGYLAFFMALDGNASPVSEETKAGSCDAARVSELDVPTDQRPVQKVRRIREHQKADLSQPEFYPKDRPH